PSEEPRHSAAPDAIADALVPEERVAAVEVEPVSEPPTPDLDASEPALAVSEDSVVEENDEADEVHELDDADVEEDADADEDDDPRAGYIRDEPSDDELRLAQEQAALASSYAADEAVALASLDAIAAEAAAVGEDDEHDEDRAPAFLPANTEPGVAPGAESGLLIDDEVDPAPFEAPLEQPLAVHAEFDLDDADGNTQFGAEDPDPEPVDPEAFARHAFETDPGAQEAALAASLEQQLAAVEANDDFGFGGDPEEEIDDFEILAEADLDEADLGLPAARPGTDDFVSRLELSNEHVSAPEALDEFSDPADDPLAGFRDSRPAYGDAAPYQAPRDPLAGFSDEPSRERGYPDDVPQPTWDPVSGSYTFANPAALQRGSSEFDEPHSTGHVGAQAFDESDIPPAPRGRYVDAMPRAESAEDNLDLENALEALDVDLDELMVPTDTQSRSTVRHRASTPVMVEASTNRRDRLPRAVSEDGILIDFDDDE
nr:hypothetical protein [Deltaproteobacteria bacterium]